MTFLNKFKFEPLDFKANETSMLFCLFIIYCINHGWIFLISGALFWDDWTLFGSSTNLINEIYDDQGSVFNINGIIHNSLLLIGPWSYRLLTFVLLFCTGLALNEVLKKHAIFNLEARFIILILYLTLPFYMARVALIVMPYTVSIFLFFLAWSIIERNKVLAMFLFFLSFNTNSLLVFYALPFFDLFYRTEQNISFISFIKFSLKKIYLTALPFVYFAIEVFMYPPSGIFQGYNDQFSFISLLFSPISMFWNLMNLEINIFLFLFVVLILSFSTAFKKVSNNLEISVDGMYLFLIGLLIFILGGFAYWILGHTPAFNSWNSRHQLLLSFGTSIMIFSLITFSRNSAREMILLTFLSIFLISNFLTYKEFYVDWKKQKNLIEIFSQNDVLKDSDLIIFHDKTQGFNAFNRDYDVYEWNGLLVQAFNDEKRFGLDNERYQKLIDGTLFFGYVVQPHKYKASQFDFSKDINITEIILKPESKDSKYREIFMSLSPKFTIEILSLDKKKLELHNYVNKEE
tara:strand:- start:2970 stop:4520 length:1551 start_codon:yes stop_codon:yes gene_type:complete